MNKKWLTLLSAICFFIAAIIFFAVTESTALGICFTALGAGAIIRFFVMNKNS